MTLLQPDLIQRWAQRGQSADGSETYMVLRNHTFSSVYCHHDQKTEILHTVFIALQHNVFLPGNDRKSDAPDAIAFLKAARNGNLDDIEAVLNNQEFELDTISTDGVSLYIFLLT